MPCAQVVPRAHRTRSRLTYAHAVRISIATLGALVSLVGTSGSASAQEDEPAPKIAVVVLGDPDDELRARAMELEDALAESGEVRVPSDPGLRAALRGEAPSAEDDGLERVRAERRRVVLEDLSAVGESDMRALRALGRSSGATAVVVLRRSEAGAIEALVMDVGRRALYEGEVATDDLEAARAFVVGRVRSAARAAARGEGPVAPERPAEADTSPAEQPATPVDEEEEDGGIFSEWPFIVAGVLLAGFVLFLVLDDEPAEQGPPVLRFTAGGR